MGVDTFWYKDNLDISTTTSNLADLEKNVKNCTKCNFFFKKNTIYSFFYEIFLYRQFFIKFNFKVNYFFLNYFQLEILFFFKK